MEDAMIQLGPEAKSLLEAARDGDEPRLEEQSRVRAAIAAKLIVGVAAASATTAVAKSTAAAAGGTAGGAAAGGAAAVPLGLAAKAIISVALVSAVGVGAAVAVRPIPSATAPSTPAVLAPPPARASATQRIAPEPTPRATATASEKPTARAIPVPASSAVAPPLPPSTAVPTAEVESEVLLISEAHAALQAGDALPALVLLDEHARRFPAGALTEERESSRVAALCVLGRGAEARALAEQFLRVFPNSLHAARLRSSCGAGSQTF
jgi:hypothetical protein